MLGRKRLQVFVSSTYTDLHAERQAAVEAILTSGHIPAGMELFAAGDQSQMTVIRHWIDESDVFLLILGGRYGSLEPTSQKSYTHLEYEYALERGKPLFAVVITDEHLDEKIRTIGKSVIEVDNPHKLREFRGVVLQRLVKFWSDPRDIKLAVHETMAEFSRRSELIGWVPGDQAVNTAALAEEIARLTRENARLREQLTQASPVSATYNSLSFVEMCSLLTKEVLNLDDMEEQGREGLNCVARSFGDPQPSALHVFWFFREIYMGQSPHIRFSRNGPIDLANQNLKNAGLIQLEPNQSSKDGVAYRMTDSGRQFLLRLTLERGTDEARRCVYPRDETRR